MGHRLTQKRKMFFRVIKHNSVKCSLFYVWPRLLDSDLSSLILTAKLDSPEFTEDSEVYHIVDIFGNM